MPNDYPDVPEQRLAYDLDGSQLFNIFLSGIDEIVSDTDKAHLNNEHGPILKFLDGNIGLGGAKAQWLFPGPRDLFGCWAAGQTGEAIGGDPIEAYFDPVEYSVDTTSWNSGTWTDAGITGFGPVNEYWDRWRTEIQIFSAEGCWGIRGHNNGNRLHRVHIYGEITPSAHPDRIIVLDKATGLELGLYDWANNARGYVATKVLQVKNNSTTAKANNVTLSFDSLNSGNPDTWHELADGVGSFQPSLNLGTIGANTTYPNDITMRLTIPSDAGMGPWTNRLVIGVSGWNLDSHELVTSITVVASVILDRIDRLTGAIENIASVSATLE